MATKKVADMTPEELEKNRAYMRQKKRESREGKPPEIDKRTKRDRTEEMRERRKKKALEVN
tara:strand:- start:55 stop:237 length:183 start_codon:yes stop_codon:yes gene_type:complete